MATTTQKPSRTATRRRYAADEVNRMEGEDEGNSDLEISNVVRREVDLDFYIKGEYNPENITYTPSGSLTLLAPQTLLPSLTMVLKLPTRRPTMLTKGNMATQKAVITVSPVRSNFPMTRMLKLHIMRSRTGRR